MTPAQTLEIFLVYADSNLSTGPNFEERDVLSLERTLVHFKLFAEFERAMIAERVRAGLRRAKDEGKQLGRPRG
jgi:hypothetical protein